MFRDTHHNVHIPISYEVLCAIFCPTLLNVRYQTNLCRDTIVQLNLFLYVEHYMLKYAYLGLCNIHIEGILVFFKPHKIILCMFYILFRLARIHPTSASLLK